MCKGNHQHLRAFAFAEAEWPQERDGNIAVTPSGSLWVMCARSSAFIKHNAVLYGVQHAALGSGRLRARRASMRVSSSQSGARPYAPPLRNCARHSALRCVHHRSASRRNDVRARARASHEQQGSQPARSRAGKPNARLFALTLFSALSASEFLTVAYIFGVHVSRVGSGGGSGGGGHGGGDGGGGGSGGFFERLLPVAHAGVQTSSVSHTCLYLLRIALARVVDLVRHRCRICLAVCIWYGALLQRQAARSKPSWVAAPVDRCLMAECMIGSMPLTQGRGSAEL